MENNLIVITPVESVQPAKKNISGKVTDPGGSPLPGVSVVLKGTTTGTITDAPTEIIPSQMSRRMLFSFSPLLV